MFPKVDFLHQRRSQVFKAVFLIVGSLFIYTLQDALVKEMAPGIHALEIIFFRSLFSFLPILGFMFLEQREGDSFKDLLKTKHLGAQVLRGSLMFLSLIFYFTACRVIDLASLYTLSYTSPLFMTLFAGPLLGEKIGYTRFLCIAVGFLGVVIVVQPGSSLFTGFSILAVVSGLLTGLSIVLGRRLTAADSNTLIVVMYSGISLLGASLALPFVWVKPTGPQLLDLLLIGILGGIAQYGFTHAFRLAPVSKIAPFDYVSLIWAILFGYLIWQQIPTLSTLSGALLIISTGLVIFYQERRRKSSNVHPKLPQQEAA